MKMEQKVIFKIEWIDIQVIGIANRMVLVIWNGEKAWMEKSTFNRLSAYYEQETNPKFRLAMNHVIRPVFGLVTERVDKNGRTHKVFETLK